ncbi:MAG: helicase-related protein [Polyangiaceae bacterium]
MLERSPITALLGPTNTGKTHRAIERMLSYDSGMIGLPLRLLAREVYDKVVREVGEKRVALVTGEEKRVPPRPSYWVCTVEAMPLDRPVDFLAIDEIQLAAHEQRGHVFTDRLLHARGRLETWFLGSSTMRNAIQALVPTAKLEGHPRLSRLSFLGSTALTKLPPRSAVIAFSTAQVYEIAERLREIHGGAAVVLGSLSPRTRNAQVAMFQAGEVNHIVATDAIGMGLNLLVGHVAFASLRKFDGRSTRWLDTTEVAQIAGRAGRHTQDGSFGAVSPVEVDLDIARAVEEHRFAPITRLRYRSSNLEMSTLDAMLDLLRTPPRSPWLLLAPDAPDLLTFERLATDPTVRARARDAESIELLWEICRIPDFRGELFDAHTELVKEIFLRLSGPEPRLSDAWISAQVDALDDVSGDVDTLTDRIASIRTWTYVTHQTRWVQNPDAWQDETHAIEDRLSDALHDRLVHRFVQRARNSKKRERKQTSTPATTTTRAQTRSSSSSKSDLLELDLPSPSHPFAALARLRSSVSSLGPEPEPSGLRSVGGSNPSSHPDAFTVNPDGKVFLRSTPVARLVAGIMISKPSLKLDRPGSCRRDDPPVTAQTAHRLTRRHLARTTVVVPRATAEDAFVTRSRPAVSARAITGHHRSKER